jgi:hypothetical protein
MPLGFAPCGERLDDEFADNRAARFLLSDGNSMMG